MNSRNMISAVLNFLNAFLFCCKLLFIFNERSNKPIELKKKKLFVNLNGPKLHSSVTPLSRYGTN